MFPGTFTETLLATSNNFLIKLNKINHFSCNFTVKKVFLKYTFGLFLPTSVKHCLLN